MLNGKKVLALIPARGGSKGIPGKNIKNLLGKPLISYTIKAAKECAYIDRIIVSTDSEEIASVAKETGAEVPFLRTKELASDTAKTIDAVIYMLENLKESFDVLILLQPTSPLRDGRDITLALEAFLQSQRALASVSPVKDSPILIRSIENGEAVPLMNENSTIRRQDMKTYYRVNGAIYINEIKELNQSTSFNDNPAYYIMPQSRGTDIDDLVDFAICQYYLENPESLKD